MIYIKKFDNLLKQKDFNFLSKTGVYLHFEKMRLKLLCYVLMKPYFANLYSVGCHVNVLSATAKPLLRKAQKRAVSKSGNSEGGVHIQLWYE